MATKKTKAEKEEIERSKVKIREILATNPPEIYTILRSVSASGMSREISVSVVLAGKLICIDHHVANVLGLHFGKRGLKVTGCGMDMGFHVVYNLFLALGASWDQHSPRHVWA